MGFPWFGPNVEKLRQRGDAFGLVIAMRKPDVLAEAAAALDSLGEGALQAVVAGMTDPERRGEPYDEALTRIAEHLGPPVVEPLSKVLAEGPEQAKLRALKALGRLPDRRALTAIRTAALGSSDWTVKREALAALVAISGNEHIDAVLSALSDASGLVRQDAVKLLGDLGDPSALPVLKDLRTRVGGLDLTAVSAEEAEKVVGVFGPEATLLNPQARLVLSNGLRLGLYYVTLGSMAMLGDSEALEVLLAAARRQDSPGLVERAVTQLGRVGGTSVLAPLAEALRNPQQGVRRSAIDALGLMKDAGARRILELAVESADWEDKARIQNILLKG